MTYMHNNIFSLSATEQASVQDQDSTTGRITLIIKPESDFNAHLINISLIIGLIMFFRGVGDLGEPVACQWTFASSAPVTQV